MNRPLIIIGGVAVVVIAIVAFLILTGAGTRPAPAVAGAVEIWGFGDNENIWQDLINRFQAAYPSVSVVYRRFDRSGYEDMLVNRLAEGKGPDVFFLPHTAIVKHRDKIFPLPKDAGFSASDFKNTFVDAAADDLISEQGEILGMPMFMDTLALFYNKDIFNAAGIAEPPKTWDSFAALSRLLTVLGPGGDIAQSGAALGASKNVRHSFEILSALMLQKNGIARAVGATSFGTGAAEALAFYASFSDALTQNYSWDRNAPDSLDAFAQGDTAMMIGFSEDLADIRERNPHLNFAVSPLPQNAGAGASATWGEHFFPAVSRQSKNQQAAWQFVLFASSRAGVKPYLDAARRPPARRDIAGAGASNEDLSVFWRQSLTARSWPVPDDAPTRRLFGEAMDAAVSRSASPAGAVSRLESQLRLFTP